MSSFFDLIDKYKFGIIVAFATYIGIFMYLELTTVPESFVMNPYNSHEVSIQPDKLEELELTPENIKVAPEYEAGKMTNTARDMSDSRERSEENWSASKSTSDIDKSVKEEERKMFEEAGGEAKRKAIKEQDEARKKNQKEQSSTLKQKETSNQSGGNTAVKGNVMVSWSLSKRSPHQNDEWNIRNPGYTCGYGSAGRVVVSIKVGQDGKVTSANYDPIGSSSASPCMIEQALKYAKLSRFDYSPTEVTQNGKIIYSFVSQ